ncbi:hypothetical protein ABZ690_17740 [Streptomyces sp. NPDC006967]|uniref:hypothetical protein n=1 Tax=Streptomyces sp. NPDC006967 TaxID=3156906 RepID=UPI0033EE1110
MTKYKSVGTSWRTVMKHTAMTTFITREFNAGNHIPWIGRFCITDLTAGDGSSAYDAPWHTSCSPGIIASLALTSRKPVVIDLYERDQETYDTLISNLAKRLPVLGYQRTADDRWRYEGIWLRASRQDGREASIDHLAQSHQDAVLILNDPNLITDWAMRPGFMSEVLTAGTRFGGRGKVKGFRVMHTLGCNVGGAKRAPFQRDAQALPDDDLRTMDLTERRNWFNLIEEQCAHLPARHDLALAAFENDPAQWAYLFTTPRLPRWYADTEADIRAAFKAVGRTGEIAFYRRDNNRFERLKNRLLLTKTELAERESPQLPFEPSGDENAATHLLTAPTAST